jgi:hypothetical protein
LTTDHSAPSRRPLTGAPRALALLVLAFAATGGPACAAADINPPVAQTRLVYADPGGKGDRSGGSPANALGPAEMVERMASGSSGLRLHLAPGTYSLGGARIKLSGRGAGPFVLEGEGPDKTIIEGDYDHGVEKAGALFTVLRSDVILRNLTVQKVGTLFNVPTNSTVDNVKISNVVIRTVHDGIVIDRGKSLHAKDWSIDTVRIEDFARVGIRLAGPDTTAIRITNSVIDGKGDPADADCYKSGIQLLESVNDVVIDHVRVANTIACSRKDKYQQGDGIEADDKQGPPDRITITNVVSEGNRDGNFDLKATNVTLSDLTSRSAGVSRYGYRFWSHPFTCTRCSMDGGEWADVGVTNSIATLVDPVMSAPEWKRRCSEHKPPKEEGVVIVSKGQRTEQPCE